MDIGCGPEPRGSTVVQTRLQDRCSSTVRMVNVTRQDVQISLDEADVHQGLEELYKQRQSNLLLTRSSGPTT